MNTSNNSFQRTVKKLRFLPHAEFKRWAFTYKGVSMVTFMVVGNEILSSEGGVYTLEEAYQIREELKLCISQMETRLTKREPDGGKSGENFMVLRGSGVPKHPPLVTQTVGQFLAKQKFI